MPLEPYIYLHSNAKLNQQQKSSLINWATALRDSMKAQYPGDSLKRPKIQEQILRNYLMQQDSGFIAFKNKILLL